MSQDNFDSLIRRWPMKFSIISLVFLTACTFAITDTRTDAQRAADAATRAAQPVSGNVHILRVRLLLPSVTIEPQVAPNEVSLLPTVTPTRSAP